MRVTVICKTKNYHDHYQLLIDDQPTLSFDEDESGELSGTYKDIYKITELMQRAYDWGVAGVGLEMEVIDA